MKKNTQRIVVVEGYFKTKAINLCKERLELNFLV